MPSQDPAPAVPDYAAESAGSAELLDQYCSAIPKARMTAEGAAYSMLCFGWAITFVVAIFWLLSIFVWTGTPHVLLSQGLATAVLAGMSGGLLWIKRRGDAPLSGRVEQFTATGLRQRLAAGQILPNCLRQRIGSEPQTAARRSSRETDLMGWSMYANLYLSDTAARPFRWPRYVNAVTLLLALTGLALWTKVYSLPLLPALLALSYVYATQLMRWNLRALDVYLGTGTGADPRTYL